MRRFRKINIIKKIQNYKKITKKDFSLLFKKELEEKKENDIFYYHKEETEEKKKKPTLLRLSEKSNILSSEIYQKIRLMKNHSENLKKLNTYSLQKISKEYFRIIPYKSIDINNVNKMTINSENNRYNISKNLRTISAEKRITNFKKINKNPRTINEYNKEINDNIKIKNDKTLQILSSLKKNNTSEKLEKYIDLNINDLYNIKNKNILDIDRFNDSFRIQMNNTCYKFIPYNHLKKLNNLQRDNPLVRKSMEDIKGKFKEKMKDFTDKRLMAKKYFKIREKFKKENDKRIHSAKSPLNIKLQSGLKEKFISFGYKKRLLYGHDIHSIEKEKMKQKVTKVHKKENFEKTIKINDSLIDKVLKKLNNSLNIKNMKKYINDTVNEKNNENSKEDFHQTENKYFPEFKDVNNYIHKFNLNKIKKKYKIIERNKGYLELDKDNVELEENIVHIKNKLVALKSM